MFAANIRKYKKISCTVIFLLLFGYAGTGLAESVSKSMKAEGFPVGTVVSCAILADPLRSSKHSYCKPPKLLIVTNEKEPVTWKIQVTHCPGCVGQFYIAISYSGKQLCALKATLSSKMTSFGAKTRVPVLVNDNHCTRDSEGDYWVLRYKP